MDVNASANRVVRAHARSSPAGSKLACSGTGVLVSMCDDSKGGGVRASDTAGVMGAVARDIAVDSSTCVCVHVCMHGAG